jgi:TPR repeat protein
MPARAEANAVSEAALRQQLQQAMWPGDIVRISSEYLSRYPQGAAAATAAQLYEGASAAMRVLSRNDGSLYRSAFKPAADAPDVAAELRKAALGDQDAAVRLAHLNQRGEAGVARDQVRYLGWLQFASMLGNDRASYELALHYRRDAQPVLAARYEARAIELGHVPPRDLDHSRK